MHEKITLCYIQVTQELWTFTYTYLLYFIILTHYLSVCKHVFEMGFVEQCTFWRYAHITLHKFHAMLYAILMKHLSVCPGCISIQIKPMLTLMLQSTTEYILSKKTPIIRQTMISVTKKSTASVLVCLRYNQCSGFVFIL